MELTTAFQLAYKGCGTTLTRAHASSEYARFLRGRTRTEATLDHLGYTLTQSTLRCLPPEMVDSARRWKRLTAAEQLGELKEFLRVLLQTPEEREHITPSINAPMLPAEMGPWKRKTRAPWPSCFGTMNFVAAYAAQTGSRQLTASVQRLSAEPVATGLIQLYGAALGLAAEILPATVGIDPLLEILQTKIDNATTAAQTMAREHQFHLAGVIQLANGRWACVDPYADNVAVLSTLEKPVRDLDLGGLTAVGTLFNEPRWEILAELNQVLQKIKEQLIFARSSTELNQLPLLELPRALRRLAVRHGIPIFEESNLLRHAVSQGEEVPDESTARFMIAASEHDSDRDVVRERILLGLIKAWAEQVWVAAEKTYWYEPHPSMVIGHTVRTLGVCAVINLRHRQGEPQGSDLLRYSASDIVLFHALADQRNGRELSPEEALWLERRLAPFRRAPSKFLHPLLPPLLTD